MKDILIVPEFFSKRECELVLSEMSLTPFDNARQPSHWVDSIKRIDFKKTDVYSKVTVELQQAVEHHFDVCFKKQHNLHTVVWCEGKGMPTHADYGGNNEFMERDYNSLIYLNDEYEGGELIIPEKELKITPTQGMMVSFRGGDMKHGVTPVKDGTRYTTICWWELK